MRLQSSIAGGAVSENPETPVATRSPRNRTNSRYTLDSDINRMLEMNTVDDIFSQLDTVFVNYANQRGHDPEFLSKRLFRVFFTLSKRLRECNSGLDQSLLLYKLLTVLVTNEVANISQFHRIIRAFFVEGKYEDVISLFIEFKQYAADHGDVVNQQLLRDVKNEFVERDIENFVVMSYLKKCFDDSTVPDMSALEQIVTIDHADIKPFSMFKAMNNTNKEFEKFVFSALNKHRQDNMDVNDLSYLNTAQDHAMRGQSELVKQRINSLMEMAKTRNQQLNNDTLVKIMHLYSLINYSEKSFEIWNSMNEAGKPPINGWNELLFAVLKSKDTPEIKGQKIEEIWNMIEKDTELSPDSDTFCYLIKAYAMCSEFEKAFALVQDLRSGKKNIPLTLAIRHTYLIELISHRKVQEAEKLYATFTSKDDYVPSLPVLNRFLREYLFTKNYPKMESILNQMNELSISPDVATYSLIIDKMFKESRGDISNEQFLALLEDMKKNDIRINTFTVTSILDSLMKNPSSIPTARLVYNYFFMESRRLPPTFVTYTSIISGEAKYGDINIAENIFRRAIADGLRPSAPLRNELIANYVKNKDMKSALKLFDMMNKETLRNMKPNMFTYWFLINGAVNSKDDALTKELLAKLDESGIDKLGRSMPKLIKKLVEDEKVTVPQRLVDLVAK